MPNRLIPSLLLALAGCLCSAQSWAVSCPYSETFRDEFNAISYSGNDGSQNWSGDWQEINDDGRVNRGYIRVRSSRRYGQALYISLNSRSQRGASRTLNLSAYTNASSAVLSLKYRRSRLRRSNDYVSVDVSTDGTHWTTLTRIAGPGSDSQYQDLALDISGYLSGNTRIRFLSSGHRSEDARVYIDDVAVTVGCTGGGSGGTCNYSETFSDQFNTRAYSGNDGTQNWSGDWQEFGDDNRAGEGDVRVRENSPGYALQIGVFGRRQRGVRRALDLSSYVNATTATLSFDYRRSELRRASDYVAVEVTTDGTQWTELGRISGSGSDRSFQPFSVDILSYLSATTQIRFISSSHYDEDYRVYIDNVTISVGCSGSGGNADHLLISHDGQGIHCLAEPVTVQAIRSDGQVETTYTGQITLDTGTGTGDWSLLSGQGTFSDPTSGDGQASYQYVAGDQGQAQFALTYRSGAAVVNVDATDGTVSDDDSEGNLVFSPSGLLVTASQQTNPPTTPIDTSIPAQTAAQSFQLYLTAYGQTASDSQCGVIETYTGNQKLTFWSQYLNPTSGTMTMKVNNHSIATTEGGAGWLNVSFSQGQANIGVKYSDAGMIELDLKDDDTSNPDLPNGIRGSSADIVVKPADFTLANIRRTADALPNPGATNATGPAFIGAGNPFTVQVTAVDATGSATPNFGQETPQETVLLTPTLVAPIGGHNPAIASSQGFTGQFVAGRATGTDFAWPEVGIITLTPSIGDGDYLGGGDVTGTTSGNVGRFIPANFQVQAGATPTLRTQCGTFSYMGQPVDYSAAPTVMITARAASGQTTRNYQGDWWKLADFGESYSHSGSIPATAALDATGLNHAALSCAACGGSTATQFGGTLTYNATTAETDPFIGALDIAFSITDSDGAAYAGNPFQIPAIAFDLGGELRSGRGYAKDAYGTYAQINDTLPITLGSQYYDSLAGGWLANTADSCSIVGYTATDSDISTSIGPTSPTTLNAGLADVTLTLTADPNSPGGKTSLNLTWPPWLNGQTGATASFGLFRGDDRRIHWREAQ